ncbi:MAG: hypothetical protein LC754_00115 [Acidobacteria bacterium]|nr:hypothetical protein [Acidobacteriota bacterium]
MTLKRKEGSKTVTYTGKLINNDTRIKGHAHFDNTNVDEDPEWVADKQPGTDGDDDDDKPHGSPGKGGHGKGHERHRLGGA